MTTEAPTDKRRRLRTSALVGAAAAVVGLLVGLTTLFDWFESKTTEPLPPVIDARLVAARLSGPRTTLRQHLADINQPATPYTRRELREIGLVFDVRVHLRGHQGDKMGLRWRMFARSGRRLPAHTYSQTAGWFVPSNQNHAATTPFWTPFPDAPGRYVVRFTLLDTDGRPLDVRNVPFDVRDVPELD
jgi:hypothetical protein